MKFVTYGIGGEQGIPPMSEYYITIVSLFISDVN